MTADKAIAAVADNLKSHPLAFALIVVNILFLMAGVWILRDVAVNARERTDDFHKLLSQCIEKIQEHKDAR